MAVSFGKTKFNIIATIVAITTGDLPNTVVILSGNCAKLAGVCVIPTPNATAKPTIDAFLYVKGSFVISLIPVTDIEANTETVAPPNTQYGIVVNAAENFGKKPAIIIIMAAKPNTQRLITFVVVIIPTFWLYVAVGSPPKTAPIIFVMPYIIIPP